MEEDGALGAQFDQEGDGEQEGREQDQRDHTGHHIDAPLDGHLPCGHDVAANGDERRTE